MLPESIPDNEEEQLLRQRRLLALEEQLGQHKAREGRIGRTVDSALSRGYPMPNATPPLTPSAQAVAIPLYECDDVVICIDTYD